MSVKYSPFGNQQFFDENGEPAAGWMLWTYGAGSSTLVPTYTDATGATPNANPIILNSLGFPSEQIFLTSGQNYQFMLADENGIDVRTEDNISGVNDGDSSATTDQWSGSGVTPTYINATSFSMPGDQTSEFHIGRRLQFTTTAGTVYGTVTASAFTTLTTVTVVLDSGVLDSGLSVANLSILRFDHPALPGMRSLAANGYIKSASGEIIQWGSATTSAAGTQGVTFPIPFPTDCYVVNPVGLATGAPRIVTHASPTTTGFNVDMWTIAGARVAEQVSWIAIGK